MSQNQTARTEAKLREHIAGLTSQIEHRDKRDLRVKDLLAQKKDLAAKLDEANKTVDSQRLANLALTDQIKDLEQDIQTAKEDLENVKAAK